MSCLELISSPSKKFGFLIDPDKYSNSHLTEAIDAANKALVDIIFIGGSLVSGHLDNHIDYIKKHSEIPVVLFPGSLMQLTNRADAILLLSLISGRNPEYLIGNHVLAAPFIKSSNLESIPTAYILINGGLVSSVEYVSNTQAIPQNKVDIIRATAIAGELLGNKLIYLECGSGAKQAAQPNVVKNIAESVDIPIIVGGGIRTPETARNILEAGAKMVVVGNAIEGNLELINEIKSGINLE